MAKYSMSEIRAGSNNSRSHCFVTGLNQNSEPKSGSPSSNEKVPPHPCLACNVDGATDLSACQHSMDSCVAWASLSHNQRLANVQCIKHQFRDDHISSECNTPLNRKCRFCEKENAHHFLLCSKFQVKKKGSSNLAAKVGCSDVVDKQGQSLPNLSPVMLFTTYVKTEKGCRLGSLIDNGSTDDYITHKAAKKLNLIGQPVDLLTEGLKFKFRLVYTKCLFLIKWAASIFFFVMVRIQSQVGQHRQNDLPIYASVISLECFPKRF